jgi:PPIC-type PPIASE domain
MDRRPKWIRVAMATAAVPVLIWGGSHGLAQQVVPASATAPAPFPAPPSDNANRWVAVIYGNIPITREELAEYLIERNSDKLDLLVNKKIIEHACQLKGVDVTQAEVDAALAEDLKGMNVTLEVFVNNVLKNYRKSLLEWKQDVIRPKLQMTKLCRDRVQVTDKDYQDAFDAYYGEKIECRMILFPKGEEKQAMSVWSEIRKSEENFNRYAKQQASPSLAATGGQIRPIGRHTAGNDELEKEAFTLQPGDVSRLIGTPEGEVVLKCVRRIPPDASKNLVHEKQSLTKEILDRKIQQEMKVLFKELRDGAQPKLFLKAAMSEQELERDVKATLKETEKLEQGSSAHR